MSGVWVFKKGVMSLEIPGGGSSGSSGGAGGLGGGPGGEGSLRRKVLIHLASGEVVSSMEILERRLAEQGWERYSTSPELVQFHKPATVHLISVPGDFGRFTSVHMYDVVVKCRNVFEVRDA
ncbi:flowering-promoting factor 1-like protein 3 [Zingiber officinale]|uniref:Flowering-promoting factor 1-like protein 3 n=1 Tax=Zingiber officinale TaxID=94328 RepID=A0A8J5FGL9_ZINOF|nr:flowering-promoting factor 1-like protein 3 [Zingiber officinale]KAG6485258.1 hypothetical protein ZIOFF_053792 [Zingiber officinale]